MSDAQPSGTVTLVFTDVEGSTRLLEELGTDAYRGALAEHRRVVREAFDAHEGYEVDYEGDAFFYAFAAAEAAVSAVSEAMVGLAEGPIRIRVGIHTGEPALDPPKYVGMDVHRAARIMGAAHGGQVVLSPSTVSLLEADSFDVTDLGEHRLKDIEEAVPIYQLGDGSFPPLKTISNTNLPRPASSFVGREVELEEVLTRLERGARLVTLTGPGGTGKTRLALEAAMSLVPEYKAGVFWVGLASLRDPALVTETIAQTLGAKDGLIDHIGEREVLLLLDNLEQVIDAAPALSSLLRSCPNLTLLVTSRELLRISGEVEYAVPPLAELEAVSLLCERAHVDPSEEIAQLCARLDNLPLAVELAAARVKALSPAQILERLSQRVDLLKGGRDLDPRQQTLRATIEWSYDLLNEDEQQLFARLSVFAGGCTLEAAEEVCNVDLETLQSLVEKSLLRFANERYWMLETIREYAGERLVEAREVDKLRLRHAAFFLALAEEARQHLEGTHQQARWLGRIEIEHDNARAALSFLETADSGHFIRLAVDMWRFWQMHTHYAEGRQWLGRALDGDPEPSPERRAALEGATYLAYLEHDFAEMRPLAEEHLEVARRIDDGASIAQALHLLAHLEGAEGNTIGAIGLYRQSLEYPDHPRRADSLYSLGHLSLLGGDYEVATEWLRQAEALNRSAGDEWALAGDLIALGYALHWSKRDDEAATLLRESLELLSPLEETVQLANCLDAVSTTLATDKPEVAGSLVSAADDLRKERGVRAGSLSREWNAVTRETLRTVLSDRSLAQSVERGHSMDLDAAVAYALAALDDPNA
jgi:predicted ATPase/class 3 adenylate cyclase